jgi:hypothetical protein
MAKNKSLIIVASIVLGGILVLAAMFFLVGPRLSSHEATAKEPCSTTGKIHTAIIQNERITPSTIEARTCDVLIMINQDDKPRLMAFGKHEDHIMYSGVTEKRLEKGQSLRVTLTEKGAYLFHDHFDEGVEATFTVTD